MLDEALQHDADRAVSALPPHNQRSSMAAKQVLTRANVYHSTGSCGQSISAGKHHASPEPQAVFRVLPCRMALEICLKGVEMLKGRRRAEPAVHRDNRAA